MKKRKKPLRAPKNQIQGGKKVDELDTFEKIKIGLASDEKIREWSKGEDQKTRNQLIIGH